MAGPGDLPANTPGLNPSPIVDSPSQAEWRKLRRQVPDDINALGQPGVAHPEIAPATGAADYRAPAQNLLKQPEQNGQRRNRAQAVVDQLTQQDRARAQNLLKQAEQNRQYRNRAQAVVDRLTQQERHARQSQAAGSTGPRQPGRQLSGSSGSPVPNGGSGGVVVSGSEGGYQPPGYQGGIVVSGSEGGYQPPGYDQGGVVVSGSEGGYQPPGDDQEGILPASGDDPGGPCTDDQPEGDDPDDM